MSVKTRMSPVSRSNSTRANGFAWVVLRYAASNASSSAVNRISGSIPFS